VGECRADGASCSGDEDASASEICRGEGVARGWRWGEEELIPEAGVAKIR